MTTLLILGLYISAVSAEDMRLIERTWSELNNNVEMRYFEQDNYEGLTPDQIWNKGQTIECEVSDDVNSVGLVFPSGVSSKRHMRVHAFTHGFRDTVKDEKAKFVPAYFSKAARGWNSETRGTGVILVDWSPLASTKFQYERAAKSAIDVGNYVGRCLAEMKKYTRTIFKNTRLLFFYLAGHSLGAHLMGKAGRVYHQRGHRKISWIVGLDPAGPRFVDGNNKEALPILNQNKLSKSSASKVYVIHTNGGLKPSAIALDARLGILDAIGHSDFYPNGGRSQPGCYTFTCSHSRAVLYYYWSLYNPTLFPSHPCASVTDCRDKKITPGMEWVTRYWTLSPHGDNLFYTPIQEKHWSFDK